MSRKALTVGINQYPNAPLSGCVNDVDAMANVLERNGDKSLNFDVRKLVDSEVGTKGKLKSAIRECFAGNDDIALFFFSGHGYIDAVGGYIVTPDYSEDVLCRGCSCTLYNIKAAQAFAARTDCDPNIERSKTTWNYLTKASETTCCPASHSQTRRTRHPSVDTDRCTKSIYGNINPRCTPPCCSQSACIRYAGRLTKRRRIGSPQSKIGKQRTKSSSPNWSTLNGRKYAPVVP